MVEAGGWRLRTLGAHLASGGDTRSYRATCLSDLTAHIKSPARAEHPSVPSDSHMDISSSSQSSENSLDQLLSSEHIKKII
jgi:hypothetical protein